MASGSESQGRSRSNQGTEAYQKPYFQNLWDQGQAQMQQFGSGQGLQKQLQGWQQGGQTAMQNLQNNPYLQGGYQPSQAYTQGMDATQQAIGQAGDRAMHGIGQTGVQAGQFGQSRGEVGKGIVGEGMASAAGQASAQLMQQDMTNQLGQAGLYAQQNLGTMGALPGMAQISGAQAQAPWLGMQNQASLIGPAQGSGQARSRDDSHQFGVLSK